MYKLIWPTLSTESMIRLAGSPIWKIDPCNDDSIWHTVLAEWACDLTNCFKSICDPADFLVMFLIWLILCANLRSDSPSPISLWSGPQTDSPINIQWHLRIPRSGTLFPEWACDPTHSLEWICDLAHSLQRTCDLAHFFQWACDPANLFTNMKRQWHSAIRRSGALSHEWACDPTHCVKWICDPARSRIFRICSPANVLSSWTVIWAALCAILLQSQTFVLVSLPPCPFSPLSLWSDPPAGESAIRPKSSPMKRSV